MASPVALHQGQEPTPLPDGQIHRAQGVGQGAGEVVPPIVMGPQAVVLYGLLAGLAVTDELLCGGPQVLGPKVAHGN